tara:strand:+ start:4810 stop:5253 length:444 start_codon:yes stop_codon:yes gene_type:complete
MNDEPIPLIAYVFVTITSFVLAYASIDDSAKTEEPPKNTEETKEISGNTIEKKEQYEIPVATRINSEAQPTNLPRPILSSLFNNQENPNPNPNPNPDISLSAEPIPEENPEPTKIGGNKKNNNKNKNKTNKQKRFKKLNKSKRNNKK